jgi:hypothetical protein
VSDRQETITADAPDAAEAAAWAELEKDVSDDGEAEVEAEGEAESANEEPPEAEKPEAEAEKADKPLPYEELDKRHKQLQGALGEERATRKQLAERTQQMEQVLRQVLADRQRAAQPQAEQPKVPTLDEDPIGFFQQKLAEQERVIQQLTQGTQQTVEQFQRQQHEQRFWGEVQRSEQEMRSANPDYDPAVTFLEDSRVKELELMIPDTAQAYAEQQGYNSPADLRAAVLNNDRITIARQALQMQMSPAELYYRIAQQRGYKAQAPAAPQISRKATAQATPITATKAGMAASKSLSGGGASSNNMMSADDLAQLYLDDPDKADREFKRMKNAGLLG